jgi:hypothetical protein
MGGEVVGDPVPGEIIADPDMEVGGSSSGASRLRTDSEVDEEAPSSCHHWMAGFASSDGIKLLCLTRKRSGRQISLAIAQVLGLGMELKSLIVVADY